MLEGVHGLAPGAAVERFDEVVAGAATVHEILRFKREFAVWGSSDMIAGACTMHFDAVKVN